MLGFFVCEEEIKVKGLRLIGLGVQKLGGNLHTNVNRADEIEVALRKLIFGSLRAVAKEPKYNRKNALIHCVSVSVSPLA